MPSGGSRTERHQIHADGGADWYMRLRVQVLGVEAETVCLCGPGFPLSRRLQGPIIRGGGRRGGVDIDDEEVRLWYGGPDLGVCRSFCSQLTERCCGSLDARES